MIARWLPEFGVPLMDGFSFGLAGGAETTNPDEGPPTTRLRQSLMGRPIRWQCIMDADVKARFERWWTDEVKRGSKPFWMPDPTRDGWALAAPDGSFLLAPDGSQIVVSAWLLVLMSAQQRPEFRPWRESVSFVGSFSGTVLP